MDCENERFTKKGGVQRKGREEELQYVYLSWERRGRDKRQKYMEGEKKTLSDH